MARKPAAVRSKVAPFDPGKTVRVSEREGVAYLVLGAVFIAMLFALSWAIYKDNAAMIEKILTGFMTYGTFVIGFYFGRR